MTLRATIPAILVGALLASGPALAVDPDVKCEFKKNQELSKYAACRLRAEAKSVKKDQAPDYAKCSDKLATKWAKIEEKADGACPTTGDLEDRQDQLDLALTGASTELAGPKFKYNQVIDGVFFQCDSLEQTPDYTACMGIEVFVGGVSQTGLSNGINCGPAWSTTKPNLWDPAGFCQQLTGSTEFEVFFECTSTQPRATWNADVWATSDDNGLVSGIRCSYP